MFFCMCSFALALLPGNFQTPSLFDFSNAFLDRFSIRLQLAQFNLVFIHHGFKSHKTFEDTFQFFKFKFGIFFQRVCKQLKVERKLGKQTTVASHPQGHAIDRHIHRHVYVESFVLGGTC